MNKSRDETTTRRRSSTLSNPGNDQKSSPYSSLSSSAMSSAGNSPRAQQDDDTLFARKNTLSHQRADTLYFFEQSALAVERLVTLCEIVGFSSQNGPEESLPSSVTQTTPEVTLRHILKKTGGIESFFIKKTLYDPLFSQDPNIQLRAMILLQECILKKWTLITVNTPEKKSLDNNPSRLTRNQLLDSTLVPQPQISKRFFDRSAAEANPLTLTELLSTNDLHTLFFRLNAYHLPTAGSNPFRSIYEKSMLELNSLLNTQLGIEDFLHAKDNPAYQFKNQDAYTYTFLQEMIPVIATITEYTVNTIDDAYAIISYGWKKMKNISNRIGIQLDPKKLEQIENNLRQLQQFMSDENFDKLRATPSQSPKNSPRDHADFIYKVEKSLKKQFGDLPVHVERFDTVRDIALINTINKWILHQPEKSLNSPKSPDSTEAPQLSRTNQICVDLLNILKKIFETLDILTPIFSTEGDNTAFYNAFSNLCAINDESTNRPSIIRKTPSHTRSKSSVAQEFNSAEFSHEQSQPEQKKTSGSLRRVQSSGLQRESTEQETPNDKVLLRRSNQEIGRPVYLRKPTRRTKTRTKSANYTLNQNTARSPQSERKSTSIVKEEDSDNNKTTLQFFESSTSSRSNSSSSSSRVSPRETSEYPLSGSTDAASQALIAPSPSPNPQRKNSASPPSIK